MANKVLHHGLIAAEFNKLLNGSVCASVSGKVFHCDTFDQSGGKQGDTVFVRKPLDPWGMPDPDWIVVHERQEAVCLVHHVFVKCLIPDEALLFDLARFSKLFLVRMAFDLGTEITQFWPNGATLVTASLPVPLGVAWARLFCDSGGVGNRVTCYFSPAHGVWEIRADVLFGFMDLPETIYMPTPAEIEMIGMLHEASAGWAAKLAALAKVA